jgi:PAS domain-containing protein
MELAFQYAFLAEGSTLLILLAGAILLYRSFRERYLELWIAGWTAYTISRFLIAVHAAHSAPDIWVFCAFGSFIAAMALFACAVFLYVDQKKLLLPAALTMLVGFVLGILVYGGSGFGFIPPRLVDLSWRAVLVVASLQLVRFAWGRLNVGRWLLAIMLVMPAFRHARGASTDVWHEVLIDLLLGISMMTIVLDDSRVQIQRLDVLNTITNQISESREFEPTVAVVLEELTQISRAKAAWFRVLEGDKLVLTAHRGLSASFADKARAIDVNQSVSGFALREGEVYVMRAAEAAPEVRTVLKREDIHHVILVPVEGRQHSQIGTFALGVAHYRAHMANEKKFLKAAARQLGLAAENRKLAEQVAQSRNEWASTFDSIPDFILVHDSEYRILRANQALVARLNRPRDEIVDRSCWTVTLRPRQ